MLAERWRKKIKGGTIILAVLVLFGYGYFQAYDLISGPVVKIKYPKEGQIVEGDTFIAQGTVRNVSHIELNGHPIFITPDGEFREKLPMIGARTIIQIEAWDRFGRNTLVHHSVINRSEAREVPDEDSLERRRLGEEDPEDEDFKPDTDSGDIEEEIN